MSSASSTVVSWTSTWDTTSRSAVPHHLSWEYCNCWPWCLLNGIRSDGWKRSCWFPQCRATYVLRKFCSSPLKSKMRMLSDQFHIPKWIQKAEAPHVVPPANPEAVQWSSMAPSTAVTSLVAAFAHGLTHDQMTARNNVSPVVTAVLSHSWPSCALCIRRCGQREPDHMRVLQRHFVFHINWNCNFPPHFFISTHLLWSRARVVSAQYETHFSGAFSGARVLVSASILVVGLSWSERR